MQTLTHLRTLTLVASLALAGACSNNLDGQGRSSVSGQVTDDSGSQFTRWAGEGTVEATDTVRASAWDDQGGIVVIGEGDVSADGSYSFELDSGHSPVLIEALDADGVVVASALLETSGEEGDEVECTPIDTESSVESETYQSMLATGTADANFVDLRSRIDAETAQSVDAQADVDGLAEAIAVAQRTEIEALAEMGIDTSQQALLASELQASQSLSSALHAGDDAQDAYGDFFAALDAALEAEGADASDRAEVESQAGLGFRLTADGRLDSEVSEPAARAAGMLEARATAMATEAVFASAGATDDVLTTVIQAGTELRSEVRAAGSVATMADAYGDFQADVIGETTVEGSALGTLLQVDGAAALALDAALDSCVAAATTLDTTVTAGVDTALATGEQVDAEAVATAVVDAWADYRSTVDTTVAGAGLASQSDASATADVAVHTTGSFRAAQ